METLYVAAMQCLTAKSNPTGTTHTYTHTTHTHTHDVYPHKSTHIYAHAHAHKSTHINAQKAHKAAAGSFDDDASLFDRFPICEKEAGAYPGLAAVPAGRNKNEMNATKHQTR
jgi:hypothetical protein